MPQPVMLKKLKLNSPMKTYKTSRTNTPKNVLFIIGDRHAKVGSQELPGITGKFGLRVQNEPGQRLTELCQEMHWSYQTSSPKTQEKTIHMDIIHGHHQMANMEIRWIIIFAAKNGEALHSQQKEDQELIMNSLLPNSDFN